ncbi:MAG: UPF0158 family protein [Pseudonocardia sp.]|nr:UPF0158 family protein [Pseudonocardia sp.]
MLDPGAIDLGELCVALDDRDYEHSWWISPITGEIKPHIPDVDGDESPEEDGWQIIRPSTSHEAYQDMAEFVAAIPDRRAADRLDRAISGRGAFRRFKDTLFDTPELREQWFGFRDARATRRAIDWLEDEELITAVDAERVRARHPDPVLVSDPLAASVAADLRGLYGTRLCEVLLVGSRARGDDLEDAPDLDLLVVLDDPVDKWHEQDVLDETLWRHTLDSGVVVTAVVTGLQRWRDRDEPALLRAAAEGVRVQ